MHPSDATNTSVYIYSHKAQADKGDLNYKECGKENPKCKL